MSGAGRTENQLGLFFLLYRPDVFDVEHTQQKTFRIANRNPSSGTFLLVERLLGKDAPRPPGWHTAYRTHGAVAASVASRSASVV